MSQQGNDPEADKGYDILISITSDYYEAYISIETHRMDCVVTAADILDALKAKNITYGIDPEAVESVVRNPWTGNNILVASGVPHKNGQDGQLTVHVDQGAHRQPKILGDGRVDFKELDTLRIAEVGTLLASRTLPTPGEDGMTVTGRVIKAKPGKPVNFKFGKNVLQSEDGLQLTAEKNGNVTFDGDKISVIEILELRKDVGPETGNIHFIGKVIIHGNVLSGYEIVTDGDVEINGIVECAHIAAKGDLLINGGVQGNDIADIQVGGNLKANFLINTHVRVSGDIACDAILHCHIICDGSLIAEGKRGVIVGGELNVCKEIRAKTIGSEMGTLTKIHLGINGNIMDSFKALVDEIKEIQENKAKLVQAERIIYKQLKAGESPELNAMLDKTHATLQQLDETLHQKQEMLKEIHIQMNQLRDSRVKAQIIYPGIKVRIGNNLHTVKDELHGVRIQKSEGEIRIFAD